MLALDDPYPFYAQLRETDPVHRVSDSNFYLVSTWELVNDAVMRPQDFSSNLTASMVLDPDGGVSEFTNVKMPWTVKYDEYFYGLSGTLTIRVGRKAYHIKAGDGLWLPANTKLVYEAKGTARAVYVVYPVNWRQVEERKTKKKKK